MDFTNNEWFIIKDLESFVKYTRKLVFESYDNDEFSNNSTNLSSTDQEELEKLLPYNESLVIVQSIAKKQKNKKNNKTRLVINENIYIDILTGLGERMTSNIIQGLVKKGLIETAFDDESNDFVFWIKDEDKEKPETH